MSKAEGTKVEYQICPSCGLPHKMTDTACAYCGSPLSGKISIAEKLRRLYEKFKWRHKLKGRRKSPASAVKRALSGSASVILGILLLSAGGWMLYAALRSQSFSEFIIGLLLALYGGYAVYHAVKKPK
ncbi:MAG: hypothetical protein HZB29_00680 [Nitrospinae bacterium]|nr:hypothetical protein [Nitrospinota bacterium]